MINGAKNLPVLAQSFQIVEQADDEAIIEMMTGQAIQKYVYSFKQGGQTVEGLTLAGINETANRRGGIQVETPQFQETESSWVAIVKAVDTVTGSSRYGAFEQPKTTGGKEDPFAFTKAIHKAQRNAIKQLLPVPVIQEVLNFYLHGKKTPAPAPKRKELSKDKPIGPERAEKLVKGCIAKIGQAEYMKVFEGMKFGVPVEDLTEQQGFALRDAVRKVDELLKLPLSEEQLREYETECAFLVGEAEFAELLKNIAGEKAPAALSMREWKEIHALCIERGRKQTEPEEIPAEETEETPF